jgi:translation initiation factor 1
MSSSKKQNIGNIVYSTNPNFVHEIEEEEVETLAPAQQDLKAQISKKGRGGKIATLIFGFRGSEKDLESLSKTLKVKCGIGGSVKDGEILLQGDVRQKSVEVLKGLGYKARVI